MEQAWKQKRRHAVDCDLKAFFDTVNHDRLLARLREKIGGGTLLRLIGRYLRAGVELPDGTREATPLGVPQGGPLSPLLANIVLDPLDKELTRRGHTFARYADDFLILVKSAKAAERVMDSVTRYVENELKLVVNRTKSQCAPLSQCTFLGFQISTRGKVKWTEKAMKRYKQRVREITRRNRGHRTQDVIDELRRYATGWMNYFGISHTYREVLELDDWLRRRVRLYYWKQWSRPEGDSQPAGCPEGVAERRQKASHATAQLDQTGGRPRQGAYGQSEPERVLAHECQIDSVASSGSLTPSGQPVGCRPHGCRRRSAASCNAP